MQEWLGYATYIQDDITITDPEPVEGVHIAQRGDRDEYKVAVTTTADSRRQAGRQVMAALEETYSKTGLLPECLYGYLLMPVEEYRRQSDQAAQPTPTGTVTLDVTP
jgi:hypothetical protein